MCICDSRFQYQEQKSTDPDGPNPFCSLYVVQLGRLVQTSGVWISDLGQNLALMVLGSHFTNMDVCMLLADVRKSAQKNIHQSFALLKVAISLVLLPVLDFVTIRFSRFDPISNSDLNFFRKGLWSSKTAPACMSCRPSEWRLYAPRFQSQTRTETRVSEISMDGPSWLSRRAPGCPWNNY